MVHYHSRPENELDASLNGEDGCPPLDGCSEALHKKRLGGTKNRVPLLLGESSNWKKKVKGTKCALICLPPVDDNGPNRCWREMAKWTRR